jgi:clan AA aspartic protease (TIGR02281 family)
MAVGDAKALIKINAFRQYSDSIRYNRRVWEVAVLKRLVFLCVLQLIFSHSAFAQNAPSFDCSRAPTPDERTICGNARLSELDRVVAAGYQYVRQQYGDAEAKRIGRPLLQLRHACAADEACIEQRQLFAIKQFQSLGAPVHSISASLPSTNLSPPSTKTLVQLKSDGAIFVVPVEINGAITLDFVIDSGASDVSLPADVVSTLIRTRTIQSSDFVGKQTYVLADGSEAPSAVFIIRSLKVGNHLVENVRGVIAPAQGFLLLGQSFLRNFKSWSIDNTKHVLILE